MRGATAKIGTALDTNLWTGQREYLPSGTDTMAENVVRDAHKEEISVDEYLRQNSEHYTDENGEYNKIAMTAIALERKEAWRQWSLSGEPMDAETASFLDFLESCVIIYFSTEAVIFVREMQ